MTVEQIIGRCQVLYDDLEFKYVREWKSKKAGRKAVGYMPIYIPRELVRAAGILPVGLMGGGDQLEIIRGDSYFQSYICHIPRSTIELGLLKRFDDLDGLIFPSTCDVIRNLSGMWKLLFPDRYVKYFDVPQNFDRNTAGTYYRHELQTLQTDFERLSGQEISAEGLRKAIRLYNENRRLIRELYDLRCERPWLVPTTESYLLLRAGNLLDVEEHNRMLADYLRAVIRVDRRPLDNSRVVIRGVFCEQPPLNLIKTLERSGCYIVEDDFVLVSRWIRGDIPTEGDPLENLVRAFLEDSVETAVRYDSADEKGTRLIEIVRKRKADGVIFCAPSFCDPALLDQPMLTAALEKEEIPYTHFKFAENTGQFQVIREQAGTFSDSVKLWGTL
ncbi:MAG TPA: benzoyl-CoA reductase subunit C [Bdellovibrionota bacterium]|nr:benzoyl-CoA reductase subunit C [Bdellovibrionota bacterium]